ncbi:hypothetical protein HNP32_001309 [Brevundimonas bullata]|uniref:Uncharacterized protein n=1 Tax=Brevundimonas bullata TaxID=13160 RepID=A0A7W7N2Q6_9CAUL|nr:hypothetical protein [Brevundimonas bullata]MBB4797585.1 hypothetical protein [Brevundimonas bullata]MBB6382545.1 hypothetical protein [Brevundimonas bullata]
MGFDQWFIKRAERKLNRPLSRDENTALIMAKLGCGRWDQIGRQAKKRIYNRALGWPYPYRSDTAPEH